MPNIVELPEEAEVTTKVRPCIVCHVDVVVPIRARDLKVCCSVHNRKLVSNPFEELLSNVELIRRLEGRTVALKRTEKGVTFREDIVIGRVKQITPARAVQVLEYNGGFRWFGASEVESVR